MSDISAELSRVQSAYAQPTLTLLRKTTAPVIVAIFRTLFSRDTPTITAARLHDKVEALLADLRQTVDPMGIPGRTGRDLCQQWMRDQWLIRTTNDDGTEVYTLTSHTQQALRLVEWAAPRPVPHLTPAETELYAKLTSHEWTRFRRVEQERIPLRVALRAFRALAVDLA